MNMYQPSSPFDFPVEIVDGSSFRIFDENGLEMNVPSGKHQAVIRSDTRDVLAIHGGSYKLTPHSEVADAAMDAIRASGVDLEEARIRDRVYDNGAKMLRTVSFPAITTQPRVGDIVEFEIVLRNSYDGSWRYGMSAGARRLICLNGMTLPSGMDVSTSQRHTRKIDTSSESQKISNALDAFQDAEGIWHTWSGLRCTKEDVQELWAGTLAHSPSPSAPDKVNGRLMDRLIDGWNKESWNLGPTPWAAYNVATSWASHSETKGKVHEARKRRHEAVDAMINSPKWLEMVS